ncbi:hypothetical protein HDV06_006477 [Boothiomyces sp. JEL0866]|nr:hypothetical protein HDV06_006466 [Boothiomyces sp. JEL0866]KAJ3324584.1 hypothetical protein HDV06_006477 [Boothiomyces sp. JEL0866]
MYDHGKEEQRHFHKVIEAFAEYRKHSCSILNYKIRNLELIPTSLREKMIARLTKHYECINMNSFLFHRIIEEHPVFIEKQDDIQLDPVSEQDHDKVRSTLKQIVRDWTSEGEQERRQTYLPILEKLDGIYANIPIEKRGEIKVLCPGAGLGRLVFEIVRKGYSCQGNEFSFFMLLTSNFILNLIANPNSVVIYPYIHQFSNMPSGDIQTRAITFPDVQIYNSFPKTADFSMVAGDFVEVYSEKHQESSWDVIVTCYFMDTAKNLIDYLKVLRYCLKNGGKWINLGPLLYHFEGSENSFEYTLEEFKDLAGAHGFLIQEETSIDSTYSACQESLMHYVYHNSFFTAILNKN